MEIAEPRPNQLYDEILPKVEIFAWVLAIIGYVLKWLLVSDGNVLLVMGLAGAAMCSFLSAFVPNPPRPDEEYYPLLTSKDPVKALDFFAGSVAPKWANIGGAVTLLGILFKLMNLQGYQSQLLVGVLSLVSAIVLLAIGRRLHLRAFVIVCLGFLALFTPSETLIRQFHRDDSALAEKLIYQLQHPRDTAATAAVHAHSPKN